jgi:hypothetical protein
MRLWPWRLQWDINSTLWGKQLFGLIDKKMDLDPRAEADKERR